MSPLVDQLRDAVEAELRSIVSEHSHELQLSQDVEGSSAAATSRELGSDLAYRGVLLRHFGRALCVLL